MCVHKEWMVRNAQDVDTHTCVCGSGKKKEESVEGGRDKEGKLKENDER